MLPIARGKVSLPEGSSINSWTLAAAVASAVAPDRREVRGADLITDKRVRPVWNPGGWERRQLDAEDRAALQASEGALPAIHGRMTDEEIAAFTDRWRSECAEALSARGHAYWEPIIPTSTQLYAEHIKNLDVRTRCLESLRTLVEEGQIRVSRNNEPSRIVDTLSVIPRADALKYLEWIDLEVLSDPQDAGDTSQALSEGDVAEGRSGRNSMSGAFGNGLQVVWTTDRIAEAEAFLATHTWEEFRAEYGCSRQRFERVKKRERNRIAQE